MTHQRQRQFADVVLMLIKYGLAISFGAVWGLHNASFFNW